jgi:hypothetical protein
MPKILLEEGFCCRIVPQGVKMVRAVSVYLNTAWALETAFLTSFGYLSGAFVC